jgi:C-terminal processing protease CtpA/Prc
MKYFISCLLIFVVSTGLSQTVIKSSLLLEDFEILKRSYESLHPGLYKYQSKEAIDKAFEKCRVSFSKDLTLQETYKAILELTATFQCGHAYPNFWNQDSAIQNELFENATALPFHFEIIESKLAVTRSADAQVLPYDIIETINHIPVSQILDRLLPSVRADGSNDGKRLSLLQIKGQYKYNYFDIIYPFYFPSGDKFSLGIKRKDARLNVIVTPIRSEERDKQLANAVEKFRKKGPMAFYWKQDGIAVLEVNDLADYNSSFKFSEFLHKSVMEYNQKAGKCLIIDARVLEGGTFDIAADLIGYLSKKKIEYTNHQNVWAYVSIDSALAKYITNKSWAGANMYRSSEDFTRLPSGQFRPKKNLAVVTIQPHEAQFSGKVYLLTSPENSSAGYQFADILKSNKLATLIGQTTGGNHRGITGGTFFFIELPNSKIEVDIPLKGYDYDLVKKLPDEGLRPDIFIKPSIEGFTKNIDKEMTEAIKLFKLKRSRL